jgi:hypothetical protein
VSLRVFVLLRRGSLPEARHVVDRSTARDDARLRPAAAAVQLLAGDIAGGRLSLREAGSDAQGDPSWWLVAALADLLELRYADALATLSGARARLGDESRSILRVAYEAWALAGLDAVDRMSALARHFETETRSIVGALVTVLMTWRRGDLRACAEQGVLLLRELAAREERLLQVLVAAVVSDAWLGLGELRRAEELARDCEGEVAEGNLVGLGPFIQLLRLRIDAARGDWDRARSRVAQAAAVCPRSPIVAVEREGWCLDIEWARDADAHGSVSALVALRRSESALHEHRWREAHDFARAAERWYREAGCGHPRAQALLARAEALAHLGELDRAETMLRSCRLLAGQHGYRIVQIASALIGAHTADRTGDLERYVSELRHAAELAGKSGLCSQSLARACERVGLYVDADAFADGQPMRDRVRRLRLARPVTCVCAVGRALYLLGADDPLPEAEIAIHLDEECVEARGQRHSLTRQQIEFLALFAQSDEGVSAEELYLGIWPGGEYHTLRNRNAVHVALTRLRAALEPIVGADVLQKTTAGRYRLTKSVVAAVYWKGPPVLPLPPNERLPPAFARWRRLLEPSLVAPSMIQPG